MFPDSLPAPEVVMITLVPPFNLSLISATEMLAPEALEIQVPPDQLPLAVGLPLIVTSYAASAKFTDKSGKAINKLILSATRMNSPSQTQTNARSNCPFLRKHTF
jgi:hypothetical protein